jgi:hypothetical protein
VKRLRWLAGALVVPAAATAAWAMWTADVAPGGHGAAAAEQVAVGERPVATAERSSVTVSWDPSELTDGTPVTGYVVTRTDATTGARAATGPACAGVVTATTCTEPVPDGSWRYTVTPAVGTHWRGPVSPESDPVVVDTTGPTGGSVDARGLHGTGSRYATTTTLTLDLVRGTDPNGVAATGATLHRATAPLASSNGACGTWTPFTHVATDPVTPLSQTVSGGTCYRYRYEVADTFGNATSNTTPDIKVDVSRPSPPTLGFTAGPSTTWRSGYDVYFRPTASSGLFTVTASATDPQSGITGYAFGMLGGWVVSPSDSSATYSWSGTPASGTVAVTATNHAGQSSATSFNLVPDTTPPAGSSVNYVDGRTTNTRLAVGLVTGTDSQSGVATRLLQRATATVSSGSCGSFSSFTTIATNPASPYTDNATSGRCYRYQYVVSDNVGNSHTATSTSVAKVVSEAAYASAVRAAGATSLWRLGESTLAEDSFTGTTGATLQSRSGELGASWAKLPLPGVTSADPVLTSQGRLRRTGAADAATGTVAYASATPVTADYTASADLHVASLLANDNAGVMGRVQETSRAAGYGAAYDVSTQTWQLVKLDGSSRSVIAMSGTEPLTAGATYRLALEMAGNRLRLLVDGVEKVRTHEGSYATPGRGGVTFGLGYAASVAPSATTGLHLDDFRITPPMRDSIGSAHGAYPGTARLGEPGHPGATDLDTAMRLDWTDGAAVATRPLAAGTTVELLFRSGAHAWATGANWWEGRPVLTVDLPADASDFGLSLGTDGKLLAGVGRPGATVATPYAVNDGAWHHFTLTRSPDGTYTLSFDGERAGSISSAAPAAGQEAVIRLGPAGPTAEYVDAFLDEVAVYDTVLGPATISSHAASR